MNDETSWIFVSHSSADLRAVRKVRNYLEDRGAAPLLFHLLALSQPDEFWPLIRREVEVRRFFLYCESPNAEASEWVRRERELVAELSKLAPKRIARIRVDQPEIDFRVLDGLLQQMRVWVAYAKDDTQRVRPYVDALQNAGFTVVEPKYLEERATGTLQDVLRDMQGLPGPLSDLRDAVAQLRDNPGFVVPFYSQASHHPEYPIGAPSVRKAQFFFDAAMNSRGDYREKLAPVLLDAVAVASDAPPEVSAVHDPGGGPAKLVAHLLRR